MAKTSIMIFTTTRLTSNTDACLLVLVSVSVLLLVIVLKLFVIIMLTIDMVVYDNDDSGHDTRLDLYRS